MQILEKTLCTGCGACAHSCGKQAITMTPDENGFLYPLVDTTLCVSCGLCKNTCPVLTGSKQPMGTAYAAMAEDGLRLESSSGGMFTRMAEYILGMGGVVFGAAFNGQLQLGHIAVEDPAQLGQLRGSKYVQSVIGDSYKQAKAALTAGRPVLFTGTPCQINGLRSFLGKDYDYLYCQDIICHGVPAPDVWQRYIAYRERAAGSKVVGVNFRNKKMGWKGYQLQLDFADGQQYSCIPSQDPYMQAFLGDLCLRESCHHCSAKGDGHCADITLGDFWGVEQLHPSMFDNKGTSLVFVHTKKGQQLFDAVSTQMRICQTDGEKAVRFNPAMIRPSVKNKNREKFLRDIQSMDFQKCVTKYRPKHPIRALKAALKGLIKR